MTFPPKGGGRSKPRALNYTLELIEQSRDHPPDYVFILDADYLLPSNALRTLVGIMENAPPSTSWAFKGT
ncbi:hypothetical protein [Thermococcus sp. JCM 11816]|uniref:hypothetical protein n=1 Tax=Thermococcus sp. (strain JCM 11816 / KS-1) TaxID=1295125 RepID=UPI000A66DC89